MSEFIVNAFQVPNAVHDEVMPILSDTALRCYLTIIRQTIGWQKEKDKISISQFVKKTNRCRPSVIKAINELEELELITKTLINYNGGKIAEYSINLNFEGLKKLTSKESLLVKKVNSGSKESLQKVVKKVNTQKDTITKDTIINTLAKGEKLEDIFNVGTKEDFSQNKPLALSILVNAFDISPDIAEQYIKHRKKRKASITLGILSDYVKKINLVNNTLSKKYFNFEPLTIDNAIEFMMERGYQGLFANALITEFESNRSLEQQAQPTIQQGVYNPFIGSAEEIILGEDCIL